MVWKRLLIVVVAVVALFFAAAGVLVKCVATPEVITPRIEEVVQGYIKSKFSIESVDLTLVSNFPFVTLRIDSLRIAQGQDSISDLLMARHCAVTLNPYALLRKKVVIRNVELSGASIYLFKSGEHRPINHFDFGETETVESSDTLSSFDFSEYSIRLDRFVIDSAQIIVRDDDRKFYTQLDNFGVDLSLRASSSRSGFRVKAGFGNLLVWRDGDVLVKRTSMQINSAMRFNRDSMKLEFNKADLRVNNIDLKASGVLRGDTLSGSVDVDVTTSLSTPSLGEFLALIPSTIVDPKEGLSSSGSVNLDATIKGVYSDESMPKITATLFIDDATAKYASKKVSLENIDCDADFYIDLNDSKSSYADVRKFTVSASNVIDLAMDGKVTNMIDSPWVDFNIKSFIDFDHLGDVVPLQDGVDLCGSNRSDLKAQFAVADIQSSNYGNLYINGDSKFSDVSIEVDGKRLLQDSTSNVYLSIQMREGSLLFGDRVRSDNGSRTLLATVNFSDFGFRDKTGQYATIKDLKLTAGANFDRKTSKMNGLGINAVAKDSSAGIDSLFAAELISSDVTLTISPRTKERDAYITAKIKSEEVVAQEPVNNSDMTLSGVNMELTMLRLEERKWALDGKVGFNRFNLFSALFPLNVEIADTDVAVQNKKISLNNANIKMGESQLVATGEINNLMQKLFVEPRSVLSGRLSVNSRLLNLSELIEATNQSVLLDEDAFVDSLAVATVDSLAVDSTMMLLLPRRTDFTFDFNVDKMLFYEATIHKIDGQALLKGGELTLSNLHLGAIGARAKGTMVYSNLNRHKSNIFMDFNLRRVDINRIGELSAAINTMFPMLKSFEGMVDFDFKANSEINQDMSFDMPTLRGAMSLRGTDLVLMDSETFSSLSKKLMFKNKDRNLIDSLDVYAVVEESKIDVLPFEMVMDRYKFIVGGTQTIDVEDFDIDFGYNVSIIKSPLPFKAGVDIVGNLDDFDFKITKAKLKNSNFEELLNYYNIFSTAIVKSEKSPRKRDHVREVVVDDDGSIEEGVEESDSLNVAAVDTLGMDTLSMDTLDVDTLDVETVEVVAAEADSLVEESATEPIAEQLNEM